MDLERAGPNGTIEIMCPPSIAFLLLAIASTFSGSTSGSMAGMKLSVSLREEDVEFLDAYAEAHAFSSRSAVVQQAIRVLRLGELGDAYGPAWDEWAGSGDAELWEPTVSDGL
jgi:Arc/MetJ-type ribon-helix-helix transcriptional regulator